MELVEAVYNPNTGVTDNYFGGEGVADGPYHGHYSLDEGGDPAHPEGGRDPGERY